MVAYTIDVSGMVCSNCEQVISDEIACIEGVTSVSADAAADEVTVEGHPDTEPTVRETIADLGFEIAE